ncbi:MAG: toxin co-regulated pilus biosynthesis Q family protein [Acidithiobacillus sp.]
MSGFQKTLEVQPTLAIHGMGVARAAQDLRTGTPTIRTALRETLPNGWRVYTKPGVSLDLPVVVTGAMTRSAWTQTLRQELREAGLHGALWWDQRVLTLWAPPPSKVPIVPQETPKLANYRERHLGSGPASDASIPLAKPSVIPLKAVPVFSLMRGDLILADLRKWAKQSGWTVIWKVPEDWQVPNTTSFTGGFQQAVTQVIQALASNGANIHAVFHTANNTVVISGAGGQG